MSQTRQLRQKLRVIARYERRVRAARIDQALGPAAAEATRSLVLLRLEQLRQLLLGTLTTHEQRELGQALHELGIGEEVSEDARSQ